MTVTMVITLTTCLFKISCCALEKKVTLSLDSFNPCSKFIQCFSSYTFMRKFYGVIRFYGVIWFRDTKDLLLLAAESRDCNY